METLATNTGVDDLRYDAQRITPLMVDEFLYWMVNTDQWYIQGPYLLPADFESGAGCLRVQAPLTPDHVKRHLMGQHTMGLYAVNPMGNTSKWFAIDGDYPGAEDHLAAIAEEMKDDGLYPALEDSRRGGHLWVFCEDPVPARLARIYLFLLLDRLGYSIMGVRGHKEGLEIYPKQESLEPGQVGSGLRAPLGIHRKCMKRFWFRDAEPVLEAQFDYLRGLPRLQLDHLESLTDGEDMPEDLRPAQWNTSAVPRDVFGPYDIRLFLPFPDGKTYKKSFHMQCPSCAESGNDRGKDNLHITQTSGRPPLFYCFKGCSTQQILQACHRRAGGYSGRK